MSSVKVSTLVNASLRAAFSAWTDVSAMRQFWAADASWTIMDVQIDARPGGNFKVAFELPDGTALEEQGAFDVFDPPNHIVYQEHVLVGDRTVHGPAPCFVWFRSAGLNQTLVEVESTLGPGEDGEARRRGWSGQLGLFAAYIEGTKIE